METTREPKWLTLTEAADRYNEGTRTVPATPSSTEDNLDDRIRQGVLDGREVPGPEMADPLTVEVSAASLTVLIERDLESFIRRGLDEEEDAS